LTFASGTARYHATPYDMAHRRSYGGRVGAHRARGFVCRITCIQYSIESVIHADDDDVIRRQPMLEARRRSLRTDTVYW
jgi:hypothetical protein